MTENIDYDSLMPLIRLLADGEVHSGESLGATLGVSRTAVWKQLKKLDALGLEVDSVKGSGYRLLRNLDILAPEVIRNLSKVISRGDLELLSFSSIDSTNRWLGDHLKIAPLSRLHACTAEFQTAGRGRRGRQWVSPFASNLYLSLGYSVNDGLLGLDGLSLAVGVELVNALEAFGITGARLKWPNDVLYKGKKLAGILIEVSGDLTGLSSLVVGLGVNHTMSTEGAQSIDQAWIDLSQVCQDLNIPLPKRDDLMVTLIDRIAGLLQQYPKQGFAEYRARWSQLDAYRGRPVTLLLGEKKIIGTGCGVDDGGAFLLQTESGTLTFHGGEVSLRSGHAA